MQKICELKFYIYSICNGRFKCFRFHGRHFDFRLNSHRIVHRAMLLSAAVISASSKTNAAMLYLLPKWFTSFDSMVTKFNTFSPKNHPHHLHFRWRNSIAGLLLDYWSISKISTSFHDALMVLGIRRSALENSDGQLRYSKRRGCSFCSLLWSTLEERPLRGDIYTLYI